MNWYIGQKVICIDDLGAPEIKKGEIYTIKHLDQCPDCGANGLILNFQIRHDISDGAKYYCAKCGYVFIPDGYESYNVNRFRPLQYDIIPNSEIIKEQSLEKSDIPIKEPKKETVN